MLAYISGAPLIEDVMNYDSLTTIFLGSFEGLSTTLVGFGEILGGLWQLKNSKQNWNPWKITKDTHGCWVCLGAVHKLCHTILEVFWPPAPSFIMPLSTSPYTQRQTPLGVTKLKNDTLPELRLEEVEEWVQWPCKRDSPVCQKNYLSPEKDNEKHLTSQSE